MKISNFNDAKSANKIFAVCNALDMTPEQLFIWIQDWLIVIPPKKKELELIYTYKAKGYRYGKLEYYTHNDIDLYVRFSQPKETPFWLKVEDFKSKTYLQALQEKKNETIGGMPYKDGLMYVYKKIYDLPLGIVPVMLRPLREEVAND